MIELGAIDDVDSPPPTSRPRSLRLQITIGLLLVIAAVVWVFATTSPSTQGQQVDGPLATTLRLAEDDGWIALTSGAERPGFPEPMLWTADGICIGFGRVDFEPDDRRPSLARCRLGDTAGSIGPNMIRPLISIASGFDTWHFLETADAVEGVNVQFGDGGRIEADRAYIGGSMIALRLENGRDLTSFGWVTTESSYRCTPEPTAWRSSVFCVDR